MTAESCVRRVLSHSPSSLHINQTQHCKLLPGLVSSQAQLCRSNLELMQTIIQAAREVKKTCQKTFGDMRWNCSSIEIPLDAPKYRPDLDRGSIPNHHPTPFPWRHLHKLITHLTMFSGT